MKMKAENIKNFVGERVRITHWSNWEELVNNGNSSEWVETAGFITIHGKVLLLDNEECILQDDGVITQYINKNLDIKLEVI